MKKLLSAALIAAASSMSFAARFNQMITPMRSEAIPAGGFRRKGFKTGIKGMKSSNNTAFGANLKEHFDRQRKVSNRGTF